MQTCVVFPPTNLIRYTVLLAVVCLPVFANTGWSGTIQGRILAGETAVTHAIEVQLWQRNPQTLIYDHIGQTNADPATGQYEFTDLEDGSYHVYALDLTGQYAAEIYENAYRAADATAIELIGGVAHVAEAVHSDPFDIRVEPGATISGRVTQTAGSPLEEIAIGINEMAGQQILQLTGGFFSVNSDTNGEFRIGLRPGIYTVAFWDYSDTPLWATQLFSNTVAHEWATPIVLSTVGQVVANVNAVMQPGYDVSGKITDTNGVPLPGVFASFEVYDAARMQWGTTVSKRTGPQGTYAIAFPPGTYRVKFEEDSLLFEQEYWSNAAESAGATPINVAAANISGINAQLEYTPLAHWAFSYGLDPFANVAGWLKEDPDRDGYDNFHEFAFGTLPTDPGSGFPYLIGPVKDSTVSISALIETNLSTAYWLEYELQQRSSMGSGAWMPSPVTALPVPGPFLPGYIRVGITVPTRPDPMLFFRTRARINPY